MFFDLKISAIVDICMGYDSPRRCFQFGKPISITLKILYTHILMHTDCLFVYMKEQSIHSAKILNNYTMLSNMLSSSVHFKRCINFSDFAWTMHRNANAFFMPYTYFITCLPACHTLTTVWQLHPGATMTLDFQIQRKNVSFCNPSTKKIIPIFKF